MNPIIRDANIQRALKALLSDGFISESFMGVSGSQLKYQFSWPPETLEESQYINPWAINNPKGSMSSIENISSLVNTVPLWSDNYYPSNNMVENIYRYLILPAQPVLKTKRAVANSLSNEILSDKEFEEIKKIVPEMKADNTEREKSIEKARDKIKELTSAGNIDIKQIEKMEEDIQKALSKRRLKSGTQDSPVLPIEKILLYANQLVLKLEKGSIGSPLITYCPSNVLPLNFASPSDIETTWAYTIFTCNTEENIPVDISLRFTRADIERPWMVDYLFNLKGWTIPGQEAGCLSDGSTINNRGIFPLLTLSLILCRDFTISHKEEILFKASGLQILARCSKVVPFAPSF